MANDILSKSYQHNTKYSEMASLHHTWRNRKRTLADNQIIVVKKVKKLQHFLESVKTLN